MTRSRRFVIASNSPSLIARIASTTGTPDVNATLLVRYIQHGVRHSPGSRELSRNPTE